MPFALLRELWSIPQRIRRLENQMANEIEDLKAIKATIDAHNADDATYQTLVHDKIAALQQQVADLSNANQGVDLGALDAAIADVKDAVAAQPKLTLS